MCNAFNDATDFLVCSSCASALRKVLFDNRANETLRFHMISYDFMFFVALCRRRRGPFVSCPAVRSDLKTLQGHLEVSRCLRECVRAP